ncbi:hypothetical protein L861_06535 [Litchfieldella anticariensis FP35 = DSM 16096]|uniref:Integrating conjugative element membrane protein n=1 Tax=Litchfieldella anticariensis (strain DSM 16096 / CECT 5854 / CIP 108499 / LMG 22089 / FP35) TaxID=1121939 RepID=S2L781_LITA3|nr:TIGR03745 family integrating conjugative element membrane protein [Halomonas anticariensis]EPC00591.1 hypothetical protein L861_06535 [Halomonas anticariensis FP35 = DSM 16096]
MKAPALSYFSLTKRRLKTLMGMAMWLPTLAMAQGLPELEQPSQGGDGLMSTMQGYFYDAAIIIGLVLCTVAFLVVGTSSVASFKEARERETWSKFAITVVVGVALIVAIIWLATEAGPILAQ